MAANQDIKQHVSVEERLRWQKTTEDLEAHLGSSGDASHKLANGTTPGFSQENFTPEEKKKLASIQEGALNNPHPESHPASMIAGLAQVAMTGKFEDLIGVPTTFAAGGGDAATVSGGIRITIDENSPRNPVNLKEIWFDLTTFTIKVYRNDEWVAFGAVFG